MRRRPTAGDLVVAALRGAPLPALPAAEWARVAEHAAGHRVVDPVHRALAAAGGAPPAVLADLATRRGRTAVAALGMARDLDVALAALAGAGVDALVLKGPVLARGWYDPPAPRPYGDLDLLVRPADLPVAVAALEAVPGTSLASSWDGLRRLGAGEVDLLLPGGTPLDLHWSLLFHPAWRRRMHLPTEPLLARAVALRVDGRDLRTLEVTDTLHHLALHASLGGGTRLVWYADLAAVVAHGPDWDALVARSRAARTGLAVGHALHRAQAWLGVPVPDGVVAALRAEGRGWARAGDLLDRVQPASAPAGAHGQAQRFVRSGRHRTGTSLGIWARDVARGALHREELRPGPSAATDREAYLAQAVAAASG